MRIGVLGSAGDMGRRITSDLVESGVDVVALDLDGDALADATAGLDVETATLDVTAPDAADELRSLDLDAAASAVGPFYRFGEPTLRLAIDAGVDVVDVCDDHDATADELALDDAADEAGVAAIVGCGWTPGITNLLAVEAVEALDAAESVDVEIDWVGSAADSQGLAVLMHVFHVTTGEVPQYVDGRAVEVPAGTDDRHLHVPEVGTVRTAVNGHPEPVTLPENLDVDSVLLRGGLVADWQNRLTNVLGTLGITASDGRKEELARVIHRVEGAFSVGSVPKSAAVVSASTADGEASKTYAAVGSMADLTGCAASIGVQQLVDARTDGELDDGVYAPEAACDPGPFFEALGDRDVAFYEWDERDRTWRQIERP